MQDKEQRLSQLDELLSQPEINRQSIHEWKLRNSELLEELFPEQYGEEQKEDQKVAEGGESKTQKEEGLEEEGVEKEEKEESVKEVEKKLDEGKEESSSLLEGGDGNVDEKQSKPEGEMKGED